MTVIDEVLDLSYGEPVYYLVHVNTELVQEIDKCFDALFGAEGPLSQTFRCRVGQGVAITTGLPKLATFIAARSSSQNEPESPHSEEASEQLLEYALAAARAEQAQLEQLDALRNAGCTEADIVFVAQLVGFLAFLSRALHTIELMRN